MTEQPSFIDPDVLDVQRTALAFTLAVLLCDGPTASDLWNNSTTGEQSRIVVALANMCNSHATIIMAGALGVHPSGVSRTMVAEAVASKLQELAAVETAGPSQTAD